MQIIASSQSIQALAQGINSSTQTLSSDNVANFCSVLDSVMVTVGNDKSLSEKICVNKNTVKNSSCENTKITSSQKSNTEIEQNNNSDVAVKKSTKGNSNKNIIKSRDEDVTNNSKSFDNKVETKTTEKNDKIKDLSKSEDVQELSEQNNEDNDQKVNDNQLLDDEVKDTKVDGEDIINIDASDVDSSVEIYNEETINIDASDVDSNVEVDDEDIINIDVPKTDNNPIADNNFEVVDVSPQIEEKNNIEIDEIDEIDEIAEIDDSAAITARSISPEETSNVSNNSNNLLSALESATNFTTATSYVSAEVNPPSSSDTSVVITSDRATINGDTLQSIEHIDTVSQSKAVEDVVTTISSDSKQIDMPVAELNNSQDIELELVSSLSEESFNVDESPLTFMDLLKTSRGATASVNVKPNDAENVESVVSTVLREITMSDTAMNEDVTNDSISLDQALPQKGQSVDIIKTDKISEARNPLDQVNSQSQININSVAQGNALVTEEDDLVKLQEVAGTSQISNFAENLKKMNSDNDSKTISGKTSDINIQIKASNSSDYVTSELNMSQTTNKVSEAFGSSSFSQNEQSVNSTVNSLNTIQGNDFKTQFQEKMQLMGDQLQKAIHLSKDIEENVRQLSEKLNIMMARNMKEAELNLDPVGLGKMKITVNMSDDGIARVNMVVQQGETKDIISESMSRLKSYFEQQGITLGESSVEHQESWGDRSQNGSSNQTNGQTSAKIDDLIEGSAENEGISISVSSSEQAVDYFA